MASTKIEWATNVWNCVTGCTKVSAGCKNCYAEKIADRKLPAGGFVDRPFTTVRCHPERLHAPLHWRKPRKVFVNSMSDLFHEDVPDEFIDRVFFIMAAARQHTFQVLTKRPDRMRAYCSSGDTLERLAKLMTALVAMCGAKMTLTWKDDGLDGVQLPNVWLGVSVEDQATADERIPLLLQTPAAVRFVSYEPALGKVLFDNGESSWFTCKATHDASEQGASPCCVSQDLFGCHFHGVDWLIVGGESGPGARPCDVAWIRSAVEQCREASVPCFVKQLGAFPVTDVPERSVLTVHKFSARKGNDPAEWPADLRVREFPRPQQPTAGASR